MVTINRSVRNFRDLDLNFDSHPYTKDLVIKKDKDAIKNAIKSLVLTKNYERPFHPELGCQVHNMLFENFTPITKAIMEQSIVDVITKYEPRVSLLQVDVTENPDDNSIDIDIIFNYANASDPITVSVSVFRAR